MRRYLGLMMCGWMCLGLTATAAVTNYVWDGGTDSTPYTSWATAAHTIADAVAAASGGDSNLNPVTDCCTVRFPKETRT